MYVHLGIHSFDFWIFFLFSSVGWFMRQVPSPISYMYTFTYILRFTCLKSISAILLGAGAPDLIGWWLTCRIGWRLIKIFITNYFIAILIFSPNFPFSYFYLKMTQMASKILCSVRDLNGMVMKLLFVMLFSSLKIWRKITFLAKYPQKPFTFSVHTSNSL